MAVGLKKRRRIQLIITGFVLLAIGSLAIGYGFRDGIQYFRNPTEVHQSPPNSNEVFRLGGLVEADSLSQNNTKYSFKVTDGNETILVNYIGILPDLFREGQGVITTGRFIDGIFEATEILAKHDENYMPKEVADALKQQGVYRESAK